jgi:hypothetical protein
MNSTYKVKKYQYNYRWADELSDEYLKKTFINMVTHDKLYTKNDKSVRSEDLNFDALEGEDKKEMVFRLKQKLDEYGSLPTDNPDIFLDVNKKTSAIASQFEIWQKNMILPLSEQISEQYARKKIRDEVAEKQKGDATSIFNEAAYDPNEFLDLDRYKRIRKVELKDTYTTEQLEKQERQQIRINELGKLERGESVDMKIIKKKKRSKYSPIPEEEHDDVDDHIQMNNKAKKNKYRFW